MGRDVRGGTNPPPPPFSANIFEPVPAGAILTSLHPVGNLSQDPVGSLWIRYVTQLSADRARCRGESFQRLRGRADEVGEQARTRLRTARSGLRTARTAAAKCAKITEFSKVLRFFAKMGGPPGGRRGAARGRGPAGWGPPPPQWF